MKHKAMSGRSELGISPVLLQAIAQTLTSSHSNSSRENPSTICSRVTDSPPVREKQKSDIMSINRATSGVISHLLQNLNEPVASLLSQSSSEDTNSVLTQSGLSGQSSVVISSEEINNFLMKAEPSDDLELQSGSQSLNTVSSVLTALASQHMQESLTRRSAKHSQNVCTSQQQALECTSANINTSSSASELRSQPHIIIYSYVNPSGLESSPQGTDFVVSESEGSSDTPTAYKVLLQSPDDGEEGKSVSFPPSINYTLTSASNAMAVTDSQNIADGMSRPCPVCGDKVSGYHYGIFSCESCKGFFKRTVQNKKTFVCSKSSDCIINSQNRKKCPACRFKQCLVMGMKLEAIRQDRTRGGRSSYEGCVYHLKGQAPTHDRKMKRTSLKQSLPGETTLQSHGVKDETKSHRNLVAILNHDTHKQTTPNSGVPQIPELLRDIMNLEPLLTDDDLPVESFMTNPFHEQVLYSYMMQLAELRLYKLVRWARNLPQFGAISTDDQILLLQNCWSELIALSLCWRSIDTPNQISISSTHHITAEWAQHLGFEDVVVRLLSISDKLRKLYMDQYEYVALKVLLLITPDVKGLKEPRKIRDFQDKLTEALLTYTMSHYPHLKDKFGQLLLRLPELSRISFMTKDILIKSLPPSLPCGLLVELLKGDNKADNDGAGISL